MTLYFTESFYFLSYIQYMGLLKHTHNPKYIQGLYMIQNPEKYIGNPTDIYYSSSLEKKMCIYADSSPLVLKWGCECIKIPYSMKSFNAEERITNHTYYPDFYFEVSKPNSPHLVDRYVFEVKPFSEVVKPIIPLDCTDLKKLKNAQYKAVTYNKNMYKWLQAIEWCKMHNIIFRIITEETIKETLKM